MPKEKSIDEMIEDERERNRRVKERVDRALPPKKPEDADQEEKKKRQSGFWKNFTGWLGFGDKEE